MLKSMCLFVLVASVFAGYVPHKEFYTNNLSMDRFAQQPSMERFAQKQSMSQLAPQSSNNMNQFAQKPSMDQFDSQSKMNQFDQKPSMDQFTAQSSMNQIAPQSSMERVAQQQSMDQFASQSSNNQRVAPLSPPPPPPASTAFLVPASSDNSAMAKLAMLVNTCTVGQIQPIWQDVDISETYCRCPSGTYGFTCLENFENPCEGNDNQYFPASSGLSEAYFIECAWNIPYLFKCPESTIWAQEITTCNWIDVPASVYAPYAPEQSQQSQPQNYSPY